MFIPIHAKPDIIDSKKGKITPSQMAFVNSFVLSKSSGILYLVDGDTKYTCEAKMKNANTALFHWGYFAVNGRLVEVEEGTEISIPLPEIGSEDGFIIARFDPSTYQGAEFQVLATTNKKENDFVLNRYNATTIQATLYNRDDSFFIFDSQDQIEKSFANFKNGIYIAKKAQDYDLSEDVDEDEASKSIKKEFESIQKGIDEIKKFIIDNK